MLNRRRFLQGAGLLSLGASLPALGTPVLPGATPKLLFGYPAGSIGSELAQGCLAILGARANAPYLLECIDSRNSRAASEQVRNGPTDGSMLLQTQSTSMVLLPSVYRDLGYDPLKDFAPVTALGELTYSLTVGPMVPAHVTRVEHYLEWLRSNPDLRDMGYSMHGSQGHLATLMLAKAKSVALTARPYRGAAMLLKDLNDGNLAAAFTAAGNGNSELWSSGRLRSLGIASTERLPYWPTVPTMAEQGLPEINLRAWYAWYAPMATARPVLDDLRRKAHVMTASPEFAPLLARLRMQPLQMSPEQILERTREELQRYAALTHELNIRPLD
jgi:tripartite-type tricarboxylate transporter receptor subunit TctC